MMKFSSAAHARPAARVAVAVAAAGHTERRTEHSAAAMLVWLAATGCAAIIWRAFFAGQTDLQTTSISSSSFFKMSGNSVALAQQQQDSTFRSDGSFARSDSKPRLAGSEPRPDSRCFPPAPAPATTTARKLALKLSKTAPGPRH